MLRDQLNQMIRSGVRLVMIAVVVIAVIVMLVMLKSHFISDGMSVVMMNFSEEVVANVTRLEHEQQRHQHSHPPASRGWLDGPSA